MIKSVFLSVAGFTIGIKFKKSEIPFQNEELFRRELFKQYKGFIVNEAKKVSYWIEVVGKISYEVLFKNDVSKNFILFSENPLSNKTTTYYHVSKLQFQLILRNIIQTLLAKNNGMIIHASSCLIQSKAYLFMGPSGAGKSTSSKIFSESFTVLADDMIILKKEGHNFYLYQTPFFEKNNISSKKSTRFPVGKIFFLKKASTHKIVAILNKDQVLKKLIPQLFSEFKDSSSQMKSLMSFLNYFNEFYYLHFSLKNQKKLINLIQNLDKT